MEQIWEYTDEQDTDTATGPDQEFDRVGASGSAQGPDLENDENNEKSEFEELPTTLRGAPLHLRDAIRRQQNLKCARRSRDKRKEEIREIFERHNENLANITALEERVGALVKLLRDADVAIPTDAASAVCDSLAVARAAVSGELQSGGTSSPDNEELFEEMLRILDKDCYDEAGPSSTQDDDNDS